MKSHPEPGLRIGVSKPGRHCSLPVIKALPSLVCGIHPLQLHHHCPELYHDSLSSTSPQEITLHLSWVIRSNSPSNLHSDAARHCHKTIPYTIMDRLTNSSHSTEARFDAPYSLVNDTQRLTFKQRAPIISHPVKIYLRHLVYTRPAMPAHAQASRRSTCRTHSVYECSHGSFVNINPGCRTEFKAMRPLQNNLYILIWTSCNIVILLSFFCV